MGTDSGALHVNSDEIIREFFSTPHIYLDREHKIGYT